MTLKITASIDENTPFLMRYTIHNGTDKSIFPLIGHPTSQKDDETNTVYFKPDFHHGFFTYDIHVPDHTDNESNIENPVILSQECFTIPNWMEIEHPLCPFALEIKAGDSYHGHIAQSMPTRAQSPYDLLHTNDQTMIQSARIIKQCFLKIGYINESDIKDYLPETSIDMHKASSIIGFWDNDIIYKTVSNSPNATEGILYRFGYDFMQQHQHYLTCVLDNASIMMME